MYERILTGTKHVHPADISKDFDVVEIREFRTALAEDLPDTA
jgi:hypothetical protein